MRIRPFGPIGNLNFDAVILDLGGVILNINYMATAKRFEAMGITNFDALYSQASQSDLFDGFEVGAIAPEEFRERIRSLAQLPLSDGQIDSAWNAMLLDLPPHRAELIGLLKGRYPTFLLSNTNAIHYAELMGSARHALVKTTLEECFHRAYYSHLMHLRKPNPEVFQQVISENNLNPSRTLFIDDTSRHVEGARSVGLVAHHLRVDASETLEGLFQMG